MPNLEIRRPASVPALAAIDDSLPLARARQIVARLLETPEGTGGWFTGYAPLDPRFGPAFVRRLLKQMALGHPLNMAQLTAVARAGGLAGEAARAVNELIAEFLEARQELPVALAAYVQEILGPRPPLPRHRHGKSKATNLMADISICILVTLLIEEFDLKPTRRPSARPAQPSACAIAAQALRDAGVRNFAERSVEKIWQNHAPAILNGSRWRAAGAN